MRELESQTRKERIESRLKECKWLVISYDSNVPPSAYARHAVREYPTESGPADYALFYEGQIVGVIEAKRLSLGPQNALVQAQRYARVEHSITSPDSNRKILEEVKKYALAHDDRYGRFPKTLIFAVNDLPHISHRGRPGPGAG